ncbi:spore germination protein [Paenibacillus sp. BR2-3]|uniref:spore germination protein n=1 Tax=Paenibacillus sp. BR2-3 TaxID=3048494 RepID=UPI0039773E51
MTAVWENEISAKLTGSLDFKKRKILAGNDVITLFYIDSICDLNYISHYIIEPLSQMGHNITSKEDVSRVIYASSIGEISDTGQALEHILAGDPVLIFGTLDYAIYFEAKKIQTRPIEKSQFDASLVGSNESFNELLVNNISLIRKRMATETLKVESHILGKQSKTQAALLYIEGVAPEDLVNMARKKLIEMDNEFVLGIQYVAEVLSPNKSLFDTTNYSEKPDTVVSRLFEGRISVIVNGSPFALTAPCFFVEALQAPDDYATNRLFVTLLRFVRLTSFMMSLLLPGFYVALTTHHFSLIPSAFVFKLSVSRSGVPFPTVVEVLLMFLFFELSREAGRRLPQQVGQALSIVSALILGDAAVGAGLTSEITVVITGIYAITSFINPRFTSAVSAWAVFIIVLSACFGLHGFYLGFILIMAHLASLRSCEYPYLFPLGTEKSLGATNWDVFARGPLSKVSKSFVYRGKK